MRNRNKHFRMRRARRQYRYRNFFHANQQTSSELRLGNGPIMKRKITSVETIHYVNGGYLWNGSSPMMNYRVFDMDEFEKLADDYRMYRVKGLQLIFTKRFAFDIPLSGDDQKVASALAFNVFPGYQGNPTEFITGDSTKIVPVTLFGSRTFNVTFANIFEVTQWKRTTEPTTLAIQIAPLKSLPIEDQVNIPVFDVMVHVDVEFTQPV